MRLLAALVLVAACATTSRPIPGVEKPKAMPSPLDGLGSNIVDAFSEDNLVYYASSIVVTSGLVLSDLDQQVHIRFGRPREKDAWTETANVAGFVLPVVVAPTIWLVGRQTGNRTLAGAGSAAVQAFLVTMGTTGALKILTGRPLPEPDEPRDEPNHSREFGPGWHVITAWPSGHTSGTVSIAAALTAYYPEERWIPLVGYPVALAIGIGMVKRDDHWLSDIAAGALIGQAIGYSIGRNFRKRVRGERIAPDAFSVVPLAEGRGLALTGRW